MGCVCVEGSEAPGEQDEASDVAVLVVLDVVLQNLQAVQLGCGFGGDCSHIAAPESLLLMRTELRDVHS